jgi:hypothetical protein
MTGIAIGGIVGASYIAAKENIKACISVIRNKFHTNVLLSVLII